MTFETLLYIHSLLIADRDAKLATYNEKCRARQRWMDQHEDDSVYPIGLDDECREAASAYHKARNATEEFEHKAWN